MRTLIVAITLALSLPTLCVGQPAPIRIQDDQVVAPLYRANLYVRDIEASLRLYRDILKLKVVSDEAWDAESHGLTSDIDVREVVLSAGNPSLGNLALYEISGQRAQVRDRFMESFGHTADVATVWNTKDIWNINDEVHAAGYIVLAPPVTLLHNPDMVVQSVEMQFRDADGFLVNIIQSGIRKDSLEAATAEMPDREPEVMGTWENTSVENRIPRYETKAEPEPVYPGHRVTPMSRTTTFGRDRDASLVFYRDILGMNQLMSNYWKGVGINRIKNVHGLEQWAVILMAGDSANGNIGVYQLYGEDLEIPSPNTAPMPQVGDRGLSLVTNDIDGLYRKYEAAGFQILTQPKLVVGGSTKEMMIRDPDGTIVTFVEFIN